jgi:hypothetical protein
MDLIKYFAPAALLGLTLPAAQQDQPAAFAASYAAEAKADYGAALAAAALRTGYSDTYEQNLRLGWLCFLAKNYPVSTTYYQKATEQRPYALEPKFGLVKPLNALN